MTTSLADVAHRAGVSMSTASRVISGSTYPVTPTKRARVQQAAEELAYTPNALARALATGRSRTLGVMVGVITDPYFAEITSGVEDYARRAGYLTIVCNTDRNPAIELAYLGLLRNYHAEGIIITSGVLTRGAEADQLRREIDRAREQGVNVVSVADRDLTGVPFIGADSVTMLYDLTTYLISLGHRRLGVVTGSRGYTTSESRLRGFMLAVRDAGLEPVMYPGGLSFESGKQAVVQMLAGPLPDAAIGLTDEAALGILMALREAGVDVPGQVSVVGVNDTRDAQMMGLTTVGVPIYALGVAAAKRTITLDEDEGPQRIVLPHRIVPRQTTAPRSWAG